MMPTYSISKIAAEAVVRSTCRIFEVPTTIARLNVPYGDEGGWPAFHLALILAGRAVPVHPDGPSRFNPIHDDDIIGHTVQRAARQVDADAADTSALQPQLLVGIPESRDRDDFVLRRERDRDR